MFYTVYKITNLINNKIYIGIHKTEDLADNYMGSGKLIKRALNKYGIDNFKKDYIAIFDNPEEMFQMESKLVNDDFISKEETYNLTNGGKGGYKHLQGKVTAKDTDDNIFRVNIDDPRYISGELVHISCGTKRSEESKQKMRIAGIGKNSGNKNHMFDTVWIYNNSLKVSKITKKEELLYWLSEGWCKGRKLKFN